MHPFSKIKKFNGFALALAWPETLCKQAGAWYDIPLYHLGINRNGYYQVGHAAVVLIDDKTGSCRYFDFGRYHAPHGHGRVRSAETDHDLKIETLAIFTENKENIDNINQILSELNSNPSTHGSGTILGAVTRININSAISYVENLQEKEFISYGPFISRGTNCSRFVSSAILAGNPTLSHRIKLQFPLTISPTPLWIVKAVGREIYSIGHYYKEAERQLINQKPRLIAVS